MQRCTCTLNACRCGGGISIKSGARLHTPILFYNTMGKPSSERKGIPSTRLSWHKSFPAARLLYLPRPSPTPRANVVRLPFSLSLSVTFYCTVLCRHQLGVEPVVAVFA